MATTKNTKGQVVVVAKQLIAGTEKHLASVTQVPLLGSSFTPAQISSELQSLVTLRADVDASKASTTAKIANEATQMPALRAFMSAFESFLTGAFGLARCARRLGMTRKRARPSRSRPRVSASEKRSGRHSRHLHSTRENRFVAASPKRNRLSKHG